MSAETGGPDYPSGETPEYFKYTEARSVAVAIAQREGVNPDVVFSDALHVAVALALESAGMPYTGPNAAWMFGQITPAEVREVLVFRRDHSEDYSFLPKAMIIESLNATQIEAANVVAEDLSRAELDAFFFGETSGTA